MEGAAGKCGGGVGRGWGGLSAIWVNGPASQPAALQTEAVSLLSASFHTSLLWFAVLTVGVIEKHRLGWAVHTVWRTVFGLGLGIRV